MSAARRRGWSRRGKDSQEEYSAGEPRHQLTAENFTVDIYQLDTDDRVDSEDRVSSWPVSDRELDNPDTGHGPVSPAAVPPREQAPEIENPAPEIQPQVASPVPTSPAIAEVIGSVRAPQIVVGKASPKVEARTVGDKYRSFPFRPDTAVDGWSTEALTMRGASLRGHFHRYNGAPRQDDFAVHRLSDGRVLALVADGISQSLQSHLGATAAVTAAARWFISNAPASTKDTDWLALVKNAAWALAEQARITFQLDEPDPEMAFNEMSTTLVVSVIEESVEGKLIASVISVGDSGAWVLSDGEFTPVLGGKTVSEGGIASSAVTGLPQVPAELTASVVEIGPGDFFLLGTDGFGDPLGNGSGGVGTLFRDLLGGSEPPTLLEFARALDFSRETFDDDRTLVAISPSARATAQP